MNLYKNTQMAVILNVISNTKGSFPCATKYFAVKQISGLVGIDINFFVRTKNKIGMT